MPDFMPLFGGRHGEALLLLLTALAADMILGLVPGLARLVPDRLGLFSLPARFLEARLDRAGRSEANLRVRGAVATAVLAAGAAGAGLAAAWAGGILPYGWLLELALLLVCVSARRVFADLRRGLRVAGTDDPAEGRAMIARALGRDASRLDRYGVARVVIETAAAGFARRVVAPVFWFALLGFPGLLAARMVARLALATAGHAPSARSYAAAAMRLDHVLGLAPAIVAGWLLAAAALVVPRAHPGRALAVMSLDAARDEIVNDGRLKGAAAGALGLALGGPFGGQGGGGVRDAWIGNGRARVGQGDIRRMIYLTGVACLLVVALTAALTVARL